MNNDQNFKSDEIEKLLMTFEPNTIQHLGVKMYSTIPPALAELIANSYDACANYVNVKLYDNENGKSVIVEDDGAGMSFEQVNDYFLRIGRNRREEHQESFCGRIATGKKGLGKLALFGIGDTIAISTAQNNEIVNFYMDWNDILTWKGSSYEPAFERIANPNKRSGTSISLTNLKRKTGFPIFDYADSIAKLFDFRDDFKIYLSLNDSEPIEIDNKTKYQAITPEFQWDIKDVIDTNENDYDYNDQITGVILTTEKPLKNNQRGITLFANGRMINVPEFFGPSESSHFYSYTTGWLSVDFIDNWEEDVISTNRQSIDWENEKTFALREYLASCISIIEKQWREMRKQKKQKAISEKVNINVTKWYNTLPDGVQSKVESIVELLENTPELSEDIQQKSISILHQLIPEYPKYHWRHLNRAVQNISKEDYERADYLRAAEEAIKLYEREVHNKGGIADFGVTLMSKSFGDNLEPIKLTNNITDTDKNIERGQKHMSMGVMAGFRNPAMHNPKAYVHPAIFDDNDCLDLLSLVSYLFKKLDTARNINV